MTYDKDVFGPLPKKKPAVFHHPIGFELYDALAMDLHAITYAEQCVAAVRAKSAEMERQEPVATVRINAINGNPSVDFVPGHRYLHHNDKLYLAPGAQPAPIIPEGWKPIPEKHPTFDLVDLKLADGSVLCGCVPQSDGDYWWEGPSGEVFIDPKYAPATHWRLTAAPEAKP